LAYPKPPTPIDTPLLEAGTERRLSARGGASMRAAQLQNALTRLGYSLLSMLLLAFVIFGATRLTGNPAALLLPQTATRAQFAALNHQLGLDKPFIDQYFAFIGRLLHGDLGMSYAQGVPVATLIGQRLPATAFLGITAIVITLAVAIPLGVYSAYRRGSWIDHIARGIAIFGQSAPTFWVGLIAIVLIAVKLRWLPSGGYGGLRNVILPACIMALAPIAGLTRLLRSSMIEVLNADFIRFVRLEGAPERVVLWRHALRNAGLSTLSYVGLLFAHVLAGSIVIETVFAWPGLGQLVGDGISGGDFSVVQGVVLLYSAFYIVVNLIVDVLYGVLDPRLR
jgi:peptide/nickel transport system permease protein